MFFLYSILNNIYSFLYFQAELIASPYKDGKTNQISLPQAAAATQPPSSSCKLVLYFSSN